MPTWESGVDHGTYGEGEGLSVESTGVPEWGEIGVDTLVAHICDGCMGNGFTGNGFVENCSLENECMENIFMENECINSFIGNECMGNGWCSHSLVTEAEPELESIGHHRKWSGTSNT